MTTARQLDSPIPLADARTARIRQHEAADLPQRFRLTVAFDCRAHLLRAGCDREHRLRLQAVIERLTRNARRSTHVFVARIRAAADQACESNVAGMIYVKFVRF